MLYIKKIYEIEFYEHYSLGFFYIKNGFKARVTSSLLAGASTL